MGSTKPEKKEKKDKKRSEADGVTKVKKEKKEKKDKKEKLKNAVTTVLDEADGNAVAVVKEDKKAKVVVPIPIVGALVPFAKPLADEKATKKIMKSVRKGMSYVYFIFSQLKSLPFSPLSIAKQ